MSSFKDRKKSGKPRRSPRRCGDSRQDNLCLESFRLNRIILGQILAELQQDRMNRIFSHANLFVCLSRRFVIIFDEFFFFLKHPILVALNRRISARVLFVHVSFHFEEKENDRLVHFRILKSLLIDARRILFTYLLTFLISNFTSRSRRRSNTCNNAKRKEFFWQRYKCNAIPLSCITIHSPQNSKKKKKRNIPFSRRRRI